MQLEWPSKTIGVKVRVEILYEEIKADEGEVLEIYLDHLGYPTFGVGHLIKRGDPEEGEPVGTPITGERSREAFEVDIWTAIDDCEQLYGNDFGFWPEEVQHVLINMMFNMGRTRMGKFKKMNAHLACKEWSNAAVEGRDSLWYKQVTNRAERLMTRLENV